MTAGTIKRIVSERGFGFVKSDDNRDVFFHAHACEVPFEMLNVGDAVVMDVEETSKGPRALSLAKAR